MVELDEWRRFHYCAKLGGEGYGSTYEYVAKYLVLLEAWRTEDLKKERFEKLVILGLPQRYGLSLDFLLWADFLGIKKVVVWNNLPEKGEIFLVQGEVLTKVLHLRKLDLVLEESLDRLGVSDGSLCVSCEVFQGLSEPQRRRYVEVASASGFHVLFIPNYFNQDHLRFTGLPTVPFNDLSPYFLRGREVYLDFPPVPAGFELPKKGPFSAKEVGFSGVDKSIYLFLDYWLWIERVILYRMPRLYRSRAHLFSLWVKK